MDAVPVPAAAIRAQLAKILRSAEFADRPSTGRLLRFFVEETLRGAKDPISQREIAARALGLEGEFSPSRSAHVRVIVKRLRAALEAYYTSDGRADPLIFRITRGPYRLIAELAPGHAGAEVPGPTGASAETVSRRSLPTLLLMEPAVVGEADGEGGLGRDVATFIASALVGSPVVTASGPLLRASLPADQTPPRFAAALGFDYVADSSIRRLDDGRRRLTIDVAGTDGGGSVLSQQAEIDPGPDGQTLAGEIAAWICRRIGDASLPHPAAGWLPRGQ